MFSLCIYHTSLFASRLHIHPFYFVCCFYGYYSIIKTVFTRFSTILQLLLTIILEVKSARFYIFFQKEHFDHYYLLDCWLQSCSGKTDPPPSPLPPFAPR